MLGYLATRFTDRLEDFATEALGYILQNSPTGPPCLLGSSFHFRPQPSAESGVPNAGNRSAKGDPRPRWER